MVDRGTKRKKKPGHMERDSDTNDFIFLLEDEQAAQLSDEIRYGHPTAHTIIQGAQVQDDYCPWWLRTPGVYADSIDYISCDGKVANYTANHSGKTVRPAMWISK